MPNHTLQTYTHVIDMDCHLALSRFGQIDNAAEVLESKLNVTQYYWHFMFKSKVI